MYKKHENRSLHVVLKVVAAAVSVDSRANREKIASYFETMIIMIFNVNQTKILTNCFCLICGIEYRSTQLCTHNVQSAWFPPSHTVR